MYHFVAELHLGVWTAWEVPRPVIRFAGKYPADAMSKLFDELKLDHGPIEHGNEQRIDRLTFFVRDDVSIA